MATAIVALALTIWVGPLYAEPVLRRLDANAPAILKLVVGVILYAPTVLVGLGFFWVAGVLLQVVGVRLVKPSRPEKPAKEDRDIKAGKSTAGVFEMREDEDRLVIRHSRGEHVLGLVMCAICGPGFALLACVLAYSTIRKPEGLGQGLLSWLAVLLFAALSGLSFRELYGKVVHGRLPWVFDRGQDVFRLGNRPVRPLSSITHVVLSRGRPKLEYLYYVSFAPEPDRALMGKVFKGTRVDLFSFSSQEDAERLADEIAGFIQVDVVREFE